MFTSSSVLFIVTIKIHPQPKMKCSHEDLPLRRRFIQRWCTGQLTSIFSNEAYAKTIVITVKLNSNMADAHGRI